MINKRKLKVMLSTAVAAATLVVSSVSAFAASYTTTTTYNGNGTITVNSTVNGVGTTEQVTFLAYSGDPNDPNNIVYIDQDAATAGSKTFTFTTSSTKIGSAVKFGAATTSIDQPTGTDPNGFAANGNITVDVDGAAGCGTVTIGTKTISEAAVGYVPFVAASDVVLSLNPNTGFHIAGVILTGANASATATRVGQTVTIGSLLAADAPTLKVVFASNVANSVVLNSTSSKKDGTYDNFITAYATVSTSDPNAEYGVLISRDSVMLPNIDSLSEVNALGMINHSNYAQNEFAVYKFKALGKASDGKFAITLVNGTAGNDSGVVAAGKNYWVRPYIISNGTLYLDQAGITIVQ